MLYPATTHANVFDMISNIFRVPQASAIAIDQRQNANQLLHSVVNINPNPNKDEVAMIVVSGSALLSESGPSGTALDIASEPQSTQISTYKVQKGDTLEGIANMFDVSVNTILWVNDLSRSSVLREGQNLTILPISGIKHTIAKGDNLGLIAKKYGADTDEILKYNDITSKSILIPGTDLIIPDVESQYVPSSGISKSGLASNSVRGANWPSYPGYYIRPIKGGTKTQGLHGNNAVDLADEFGTPIYAAAAGTVIISNTGGWHGGYGNYIVISHNNGTQTLYAHTSKNLVSAGDIVKQGQEIAKMGSTGKSTGSHVHVEIHGASNPF